MADQDERPNNQDQYPDQAYQQRDKDGEPIDVSLPKTITNI